MGTDSRGAELARGWQILLVCVAGLACGNSALIFYNIGLFAIPLRQAFGLTSTQLGMGTLLATLAVSVTAPAMGALVDRFGARLVAGLGGLILALGFLALASTVSSATGWIAAVAVIAGASAGTGPVSYTRVIGTAFNRARGMAFGIALTGIGLSAACVPALLGRAIAAGGWAAGYRLLAGLAFAGALVALLGLPGRPRRKQGVAAPLTGLSVGEAVRTRTFAVLLLGFTVQSLAFAGLLPHFVPLLIDGGIAPFAAATYASAIGVAVIASRLIIGWLSDRVFVPAVASGVCLLCAAGVSLLLIDTRGLAPLTALTLGCAIGAEVDLVGFCTARYFGLRAYGRIYGILYGAFLTGSGFGPLLVGLSRDATGDYRAALIAITVGLVLAAAIFSRAPAYPKMSPTGD